MNRARVSAWRRWCRARRRSGARRRPLRVPPLRLRSPTVEREPRFPLEPSSHLTVLHQHRLRRVPWVYDGGGERGDFMGRVVVWERIDTVGVELAEVELS